MRKYLSGIWRFLRVSLYLFFVFCFFFFEEKLTWLERKHVCLYNCSPSSCLPLSNAVSRHVLGEKLSSYQASVASLGCSGISHQFLSDVAEAKEQPSIFLNEPQLSEQSQCVWSHGCSQCPSHLGCASNDHRSWVLLPLCYEETMALPKVTSSPLQDQAES